MKLGPLQKQWLHNLKTYPERQMTEVLGKRNEDGSYKACCLGEAAIICGTANWDKRGNLYDLVEENKNVLKSYEAIGLRNSVGRRLDTETEGFLAQLNDSGKTWPEIAAIIEAEPDQYFTESK